MSDERGRKKGGRARKAGMNRPLERCLVGEGFEGGKGASGKKEPKEAELEDSKDRKKRGVHESTNGRLTERKANNRKKR